LPLNKIKFDASTTINFNCEFSFPSTVLRPFDNHTKKPVLWKAGKESKIGMLKHDSENAVPILRLILLHRNLIVGKHYCAIDWNQNASKNLPQA